MRPSRTCSVPRKLCSSSRASSCARTRTRRARSVNRSNMVLSRPRCLHRVNRVSIMVRMAEPDEIHDEIVDLQDLVEQWGHEFALERELAGLGAPPDATWVTLAEAERQASVSRSTLRTWYRTGQIASRLMPGPHGLQRLVPLDVVLERAATSPRTGPRPARATTPEEDPEMGTAATGLSTPEAVVRLAELATTAAA